MNLRIGWLAAILLCALSACTIIPLPEPYQVYTLPSAPPVPSDAEPIPFTLRVQTPISSRTLASIRILVTPDAAQLSAYENARWSDLSPVLVRDHLIEAFRSDGRLHAVVHEDSRVTAQIELASELRTFQSHYVDKHPHAHIRLDAQLIHTGRLEVIATRRFEVRKASDSPNLDSVVAALGKATDELAEQLLAWSYQNILEL